MATFERDFGQDVLDAAARVRDLGDVFKEGFARHHVVPVSVANGSDFIRLVYGVDEYQLRFNSLENVILLPVSDADAAGLGSGPIDFHRAACFTAAKMSGEYD
jgi:hypothetical protein